MKFKDVKVVIDLTKPARLLGFGKPLILGSKAGGFEYKTYADIDTVKADFADSTPEYKMAATIFAQGDYAPEKIAIACADADASLVDKLAEVIDEDWYFLLSTSNEKDDVTALANAIEASNYRMFATRLDQSAADFETTMQAYKTAKWDRTFVIVHDATETEKFPEAGLVGAVGSRNPGSVTWKSKRIVGILPNDISLSKLNEIHDLNGITYVEKAGDYVTSEGWSVSGEYIDIVHSKDYVKYQMEYELQKAINAQPKLPYDNRGISLLEGICTNVLKRAADMGMIALDAAGIPMFAVQFKSREEVPAGERAARKYTGGSFAFNLAGAIHNVEVKGEILI